MIKTHHVTGYKTGFVLCVALVGTLTGCIGYVDGPPQARVYAPAPSVYVEPGLVVQDDYVYYPDYQVYYSSHHHHYVYQDGRSWVTRPSPPRVSVDVLFASPSVHLDFHDAPSFHHATVVQQYPKHWRSEGGNSNHWQDKKNHGKGSDRGNRGNN